MAHFLLCAVPAELWGSAPRAGPPDDRELVRRFLDEAQALWRRIHKRVNVDAERQRYLVCLSELDPRIRALAEPVGPDPDRFAAALAAGRLPALTLDGRYLDFLALAYFDAARQPSPPPDSGTAVPPPGLGASVFPPDTLAGHCRSVTDLLAAKPGWPEDVTRAAHDRVNWLTDLFAKNGCGVVELQEVLDGAPAAPPPRTIQAPKPDEEKDDRPPPPDPETLSAGQREVMADRLRREIDAAFPAGGPVNMSNQPHEVSTEVLAGFARAVDGSGPGQVRVVYADGSEARPFPLRCLRPEHRPPPADTVTLRACLMSMRHLELDRVVDFAWYRNKEVSQSRALAESDEFCFGVSLRQLRELAGSFEGRHVTLEVYHTGFEPASVGLYRAVAAVLSRSAEYGCDRWAPTGDWLAVRPVYYRGGDTFAPSSNIWS